MRWTQAQLENYLNRSKTATEAFQKITKKNEESSEERRKFREHKKTDGYVFCDSFYMEGQGDERSV